MNALQYYILCTLPVVLNLNLIFSSTFLSCVVIFSIGDDGKIENENPGLMKDSENLYTLWCSGRTCCEGMLVELKFLKVSTGKHINSPKVYTQLK